MVAERKNWVDIQLRLMLETVNDITPKITNLKIKSMYW